MTVTESRPDLAHDDLPSVRPAWVTDALLERWTRWVAREDGSTAVVAPLAPYDRRVTAEVPTSSPAAVADAVAAARAAQRAWAALPLADRGEIVLRFHDLLVERQEQVLDLIQWEMGKSRFSAWQEILQVGNLARHYARHAGAYLKEHRVRGAVPGLSRVREVRVPKGVVGIISPWNYPLYLGVGDALPALMAGNAVVSKGDDQTALTLLWARELMAEAGLPTDLWRVVVGDGPTVGGALIDHVDYVCFTGSTRTGRVVAAQAGERLIGASLELGGKNPLIVRADADLDKAVAGCLAAAFANTGQMCIHTERVIVHRDVYDDFRTRLVRAVRRLTLGQTFDYSVEIGSLASPAQLATVTAHVEDAVAQGATVLAGGRPRPDLGPLMFEPTVLEGVEPAMTVCHHETFGPVISLYPVASDNEAIAKANEGSYGLSASIWSRDVAAAESMATLVRAGSVNVNDGAGLAAASIEAGMGGMGQSGLGRRHGGEGIRKYTDSQTVASIRGMSLAVPGDQIEKFVQQGNTQLRLLRRLRVR